MVVVGLVLDAFGYHDLGKVVHVVLGLLVHVHGVALVRGLPFGSIS